MTEGEGGREEEREGSMRAFLAMPAASGRETFVHLSVCPPLWSALHLSNYRMDSHETLCRHILGGMNLIDFGDPLAFHIAPLAGLSFHSSGVVSHHLLVPGWIGKKDVCRHPPFPDDVS